MKRIFDLTVVLSLAPLWLPTFALVALAIKSTDPAAPILFVQPRTGRGGRRFPMFKFRTMVPDAEALKAKLREQNELVWPDFKIKRDPRITRIGRLLRKTSLDELPQLINILRAEMSVVGPRPVVTAEMAHYGRDAAYYYSTRPGLTGAWQVGGRSDVSYRERVRLDRDYVENWSLLTDCVILLKTIPVVAASRGTY